MESPFEFYRTTKADAEHCVGPRAKYQGCLIGALIGDCLGSPFEELPRRHVLRQDLLPYFLKRIFRKSVQEDDFAGRRFCTDPGHAYGGYYQYTDDTAMTHELAKSLLEMGGFDAKHVARSFTEEFLQNKAVRGEYGPKVRTVFYALRSNRYEDVYGPAKDQFDGSGSFGNGAAMRVAPVALYYRNNEDMAVEVAKLQAELTHAHVVGYNGAVLICLAIQLALTKDPRSALDIESFLDTLISKMNVIEKDKGSLYSEKLRTVKRLITSDRDPSAREIAEVLGNEITADRSVPTAVYAFLRALKPLQGYQTSNGFVRTLAFVISVGGDTDTIGTMAGAIAGAYYGIFKIPIQMQKYCQAEDYAHQLAIDLLEASSDPGMPKYVHHNEHQRSDWRSGQGESSQYNTSRGQRRDRQQYTSDSGRQSEPCHDVRKYRGRRERSREAQKDLTRDVRDRSRHDTRNRSEKDVADKASCKLEDLAKASSSKQAKKKAKKSESKKLK
ncbi:ADP-ribosylhydrolase ARH3-like [Ornithodoros turicata]|uniref:ADP-ribosylhydrolase ARH3-like n=1 Tax=Ornithodoros turicata TaxID=34597 RepID=UPI00313A41B8